MRTTRWQFKLRTLLLLSAIVPPLSAALWPHVAHLLDPVRSFPFTVVETTVSVPDGGTVLHMGSGDRSSQPPVK